MGKGWCLYRVLWFGILCAVPSPSHLSLSPQPGLRLHETSPWRSHPGLHSGSRREVSLACLPAPHVWVTLLTSSPSLPSAGTMFGAAFVASLCCSDRGCAGSLARAGVTNIAMHVITNTITNSFASVWCSP